MTLTPLGVRSLRPDSAGAAWVECLAYLEATCNPYAPGPYPPEMVRYAQLLWVLAEALDARTILEIGVGPSAVSGTVFLHHLHARPGGRLFSIEQDVARPTLAQYARAVTLGVAWSVRHGDSLCLTHDLPPGLQVDLLYIDGDHDLAHAVGDTVGYWPYLRPGGYLLVDDYPDFEGVLRARPALKARGLHFLHIAHAPPHGNGHLLLQRGSGTHGDDPTRLDGTPW